METKIEEIWKDIPGIIGYQASNTGRVRSVDRIIVTKNGFSIPKKGKIINGGLYPNGYCLVVLSFGSGKFKTTSKHILVARAFIPNPENKRCVNHKNSIRTDNRVENLEWVTHKENTKHGMKFGLITRIGELVPWSKLTEKDVLYIRSSKHSGADLSRKFNVSTSSICHIRKGKSWKHLLQQSIKNTVYKTEQNEVS